MRLMTIFELAAKTRSELDAIRQRAHSEASNARLSREERDQAGSTLVNIARLEPRPPKP